MGEFLEYFVRILIAAACGMAIGVERKHRFKGAGVRTHLIVALAASLMTIVSKYGFTDVLAENIKLDPSRVAAGVVTAVGFLGAGVIFNRGQAVIGITTAAGIWATVGVGMAIGAGMYAIGIGSAVLIVAVQLFLHRDFHIAEAPSARRMLYLTVDAARAEEIRALLQEKGRNVEHWKLERLDASSEVRIEALIDFQSEEILSSVLETIQTAPGVRSFEWSCISDY